MSTRKILKPALPRPDGVDVLRGVSTLGIILLHLWIRFAGEHLRMGGSWPRELSRLVSFNGSNGVTICFTVSGALITLTSIRRFGTLGQMRPLMFYRIRFARIMRFGADESQAPRSAGGAVVGDVVLRLRLSCFC